MDNEIADVLPTTSQPPTDVLKPHLDAAMKHARHYILTHHKFLKVVEESPEVTRMVLFGGLENWVIDRNRKAVFREIMKDGKLSHREAIPFFSASAGQLKLRSRLPVGRKPRPEKDLWSGTIIDIIKKQMISYLEKVAEEYKARGQDFYDEIGLAGFGRFMRGNVKINKSLPVVLNTCWGKKTPWKKVKNIIFKNLWSRLDKEVVSLTVKMCGRKADSIAYSVVWRHIDEFKHVAKVAPGVIPMYWQIVKSHPQNGERMNIIETVKKHLETAYYIKLTPRGWRYLITLNASEAAAFISVCNPKELGDASDKTISTITLALNCVAETGVRPRYTVLKKFLVEAQGMQPTESAIALWKAAFVATQKRRNIKKWYEQEGSLVMDWFRRDVPYRDRRSQIGVTLDRNQMKQPWSWFMKKQAKWHTEVAQRQVVEAADVKWTSLVPSFEKDGYSVVALTDGVMLHEEGAEMRHCVGSYADSCESGDCRIFSIRKDGKRLATFEIQRDPGRHDMDSYLRDSHSTWETFNGKQEKQSDILRILLADPETNKKTFKEVCQDVAWLREWAASWQVIQCRGVCNQQVDPKLDELASSTASEFTTVSRDLPFKDYMSMIVGSSAELLAKPSEDVAWRNRIAPLRLPEGDNPAPHPVERIEREPLFGEIAMARLAHDVTPEQHREFLQQMNAG